MNKISANKIISITILSEDKDGNSCLQQLQDEDAENWLSEVEYRLSDSNLIKQLGEFPDFNWLYFENKKHKIEEKINVNNKNSII